VFDEYPSPFVLAGLKILPLPKNLEIGLKHWVDMDVLNAMSLIDLKKPLHHNRIDSPALVFRPHSTQIDIDPIGHFQGRQQIRPAKGKKPAPALLQSNTACTPVTLTRS
ncbi:MAG: hypothetical protein WBB64_14910, partial [Anaerolineales bacterium]